MYQRPCLPAHIIVCLALAFAHLCFADFKVGSYSWSQLWQDGSITDIPAANQYGGGYTHLDLSWTWNMEWGYEIIKGDWQRAADCLDENPGNFAGHVSMQVANYIVKTKAPDLWTRIKAHSDAGRYDGGMLDWQEGYWGFGGDEYYLRNYYISTRFCQDNFGYLPLISACYDLDLPVWSQPKMQTYITGRSDENPTGVGFYNHRTGAGGTWDAPGSAWGGSYKWTSDDGSTVIVGTGGNWSGDGGGSETCVASAGRSHEFVSKVLQENVWQNLSPTWNDMLGGSGSGYSLFFWGSKICENRLLEAEKFSSFARPYGLQYGLHGDAYLYETWGELLKFNQHDVADVQGSPWEMIVSNPTNDNVQDAIVHALAVADTARANAISVISSKINTSGEGASVIVYNALSWARNDFVMVKTSDLGFSNPVHVKDAGGTVIPSQVIDDRGVSTLVFSAENVPSMGYKEYKVFNAEAASTGGVSVTDGATIRFENDLTRMDINKSTGAITSIYDKVNSKELVASAGNRIASTTNDARWWDDCCGMYSHGPANMPADLTYETPTSVQLEDSGPALGRVTVTYAINNVDWELSVMLFDKVPVVHSRMTTTNLSSDNELVMNMPLNASISSSQSEFNYGVAYGHQRFYDENAQGYGHPFVQKWVDVPNDADNYSVALLENNCTIYAYYNINYSHELRLVLLGARTSRYNGNWSKTDWDMSWGYWGHAGTWTDGTVQKGYEFNSPLISMVESSHAGILPKEYSFVTVEPENVVCTVVKKWESESPTRGDSLTMQVRFFETDGVNTDAVLKFGMQSVKARESMGNEYGVYGDELAVSTDNGMQKVTFPMGHNQIRSLKVQMPHDGTPVLSQFARKNAFQAQKSPAIARICNLKGQIVWQGHEADLGRQLPGIQVSKGIYVIQHISKDGRPLSAGKVFRVNALSRR